MRILLVEDDPALRLGIRRLLQAQSWQVDSVEDGALALTAARTDGYDAILLDLNLPKIDGLTLLRKWREQGLSTVILILTARDELSDRLQGLNLGADDYLTKPFEPEELVARLRALMRRSMRNTQNIYRLGDLSFNTVTKELRLSGQTISLSAREAALIELLLAQSGETVTKSRIIASMSDWDTEFSANSVEIYIMRLRRKTKGHGIRIETVRGIGYKIVPAPEDTAAP